MKNEIPVHVVKDSLIRLKSAVDSILNNWDIVGPVREDFRRGWAGDCDYQLGSFKIVDTELQTKV